LTVAPPAATRRDYLIVALVALAVSVPGLMNDFVYDDLPIIRDNVRLHDLSHWRELITMAYWPPPFVEQLYRPIALLLLALEYAAGAGNEIAFRLTSCALYAACATGVLGLSSRLLPPPAALAVAVLFAVHPVHVEAIALGVNQGEIIVGLIAVAMTGRYLDARRKGAMGPADWALLAVLYAVAALTKENGFVLPGLLLCAEATLVPARDGRSRARELFPGYALLGAVGIAVLAMRAVVLPGGAVAVIPTRDLAGLSLAGRMGVVLELVPTWFRLLAFPAVLRVDYHLPAIAWQRVAVGLAGLAIACGALVLMFRARHQAPAVSFGIAWCIVALLPVSNLIPSGVLVGERTLLLPSVGFLIAAGGAAVVALGRWPGPAARRRVTALVTLLAVLGAVKSVVRLMSWNSAHVRVTGPRGKD
jgi:hypothetical protein